MKFQIRSRTWLLLGTALVLGACSAIKLGYNNSATFAHTYLTSKVDFDSDQSALMKTSLRGLVEWHRNNELPLLAEELQKARLVLAPRGENLQPVTAAQVNALNQAIRTSLRRTADEAAPVIAKNMLGLWPNQISDIQEALNKSNQDYREKRMASNAAERVEKSVERMAERFERWLGDLNPKQMARIEQWAKSAANNPEQNYEKRLKRQQVFMQLVSQSANRQIDQATLSREVSQLLNDWQTPGNASEKKDFELRQQAVVDLVVDVLNAANMQQRNNAAERAASWAEDFQILASKQ
jgi:hypothetical protein